MLIGQVDLKGLRQIEVRPSDRRCYHASVQQGLDAVSKTHIAMPGVVQVGRELQTLMPHQRVQKACRAAVKRCIFPRLTHESHVRRLASA